MVLQVSLQALPDHVDRSEGGTRGRHNAVAAVAVVVDHRQREKRVAQKLLLVIGLNWFGANTKVKWLA